MKYNLKIVKAFFDECGVPHAHPEYYFHDARKWRFDFAWHSISTFDRGVLVARTPMVALEVQGGIFSAGRHTRGAALVKEHEKLNEAAALGWRILYVQPKDLCTMDTVHLIKRTLGIT